MTVPYAYYTSGKKDKAIEMLKDVAKTIFGELSGNCTDLFWTNTAEEYFSGLALVLFKEASPEQVTLEEIANLEVFGNERMGIETYLKAYVRLHKDERLIVRALNGVIVAPNDTRGSIQSVFHQPLGNITCQENLNEMLSRTDFDVVQMGRKQTVTFLIMPDEKTTYNFLVTMFLKQCYELLIDCAETEYNGRLPVRVNWLLEETGNIPGLQDFENMMTASRSRNIRFFLVFQSLKQIERKYPGAGEIILGNCDCILFLNSKDTVLLEYISQLAGKYKSRYGHEERDLISVTELQHLSKEKGECIVFLERNYPFLTQLPIIYDYEAFIPMKKEVIKEKPRKVVERKSFDFQELVKQQLSRECEKRKKEADEEKRLREKDIELVIEKIDRKIAELEAEERKENND